jgi:hypothetical protein
VLSLPTPPKCFAASVLATLHAAFARQVRARPSGCSTFEAIWVHLRYGPVIRSPSFLDGFVNRLQDFQFPSFLLFKLRGFELLPRWDFHPLFMPAFAGRTLIVPNRPLPSWRGHKNLWSAASLSLFDPAWASFRHTCEALENDAALPDCGADRGMVPLMDPTSRGDVNN